MQRGILVSFLWKLDVDEEIICAFSCRREGVTPVTLFIWGLKISCLRREPYHFGLFVFQVVGSQARILYSDQRGRVSIAVAINRAISEGRIKVCRFLCDLVNVLNI